jgi:hypothetical protein
VDNRLPAAGVVDDSAMTSTRLPAVLLVVALVGGAAVLVGDRVLADRPSSAWTEPDRVPAADPRVGEAIAALRGWDERRASAYASGDGRALRGLYAPGSGAGAADQRLLRSYAERGLVVRGMATQLLAVEPMELEERRLVLRVRDRLVGATADGDRTKVALPSDRPSTRVVTLERHRGVWVVSSVRPG